MRFFERPCPGGGMAYAEDLKSFVLNGTCGFDPHPGHFDLTGFFCTSGSEREFTLEGSWYADEEIQAGADCDTAAAG
jgi:hypothetical protein